MLEQQNNMPADLVAVVTGAGSGVGQAVAYELGLRGVKIALVGRTLTKLKPVQAAIVQSGGEAKCFPCDVADLAQVTGLAGAVKAQFTSPQVLVNSAGIYGELAPIAQSTPEHWMQTVEINLFGAYLICRAFMGGMTRQGWGRIINVSSAASLGQPSGVASAYQLSKVALNHFTRQLAAELSDTGVTANVLHPGEVKTEMWADIKAQASQQTGPGQGMLNWASRVEESGGDPPEKTAELVLELLLPTSDDINGQFLWIQDGLKHPMPSW